MVQRLVAEQPCILVGVAVPVGQQRGRYPVVAAPRRSQRDGPAPHLRRAGQLVGGQEIADRLPRQAIGFLEPFGRCVGQLGEHARQPRSRIEKLGGHTLRGIRGHLT